MAFLSYYKLWVVKIVSIYQTTENQVNLSFRAIVTTWGFFFTATSVAMILIMPNTPAHSMMLTADQVLYDVETLRKNRKKTLPSVLAPVLSDPCLSLLHSGQAPTSKRAFASDRYHTNRAQFFSNSQSGSSAVLSFMLGVRFAIDPHKKQNSTLKDAVKVDPKMDFWIGSSGRTVDKDMPRTTLSIGAYRQCKKEIALKASRNK